MFPWTRWPLVLFAALSIAVCQGDRRLHADNVVIVLDDSGSMNEGIKGTRIRKMEAAKSALVQVVEQIPEKTNVGVLLLNGARNSNHWLIPLGPLNKQDAVTKINRIAASGGTPLGEALRISSDELLRTRAKTIYGTYRLIAITDGEATDQKLLDEYLPDILSRGLVVDAIGVDMKTTHSLATRVHSYRSAVDEASLKTAIVEVLAENNGSDQGSTAEDFELLAALDDVDAGEILKALATPNNNVVTGLTARPAAENNSNGMPSGGFIPNTGPASLAPPAQGPEPSFIGQAFGAFCTCLLPLLIALMIFITVVSRNSKRRR